MNNLFNNTAKQVTGKSPTKFSDIKTFLKLLLENLPAEQFFLTQTNSEEVLQIIKKHP